MLAQILAKLDSRANISVSHHTVIRQSGLTMTNTNETSFFIRASSTAEYSYKLEPFLTNDADQTNKANLIKLDESIKIARSGFAILSYQAADVIDIALQTLPSFASRDDGCDEENVCIILNCPFRNYAPSLRPHVSCRKLSELMTDDEVHPSNIIYQLDEEVRVISMSFAVGAHVNGWKWEQPPMPLTNPDADYKKCEPSMFGGKEGCAKILEYPYTVKQYEF